MVVIQLKSTIHFKPPPQFNVTIQLSSRIQFNPDASQCGERRRHSPSDTVARVSQIRLNIRVGMRRLIDIIGIFIDIFIDVLIH